MHGRHRTSITQKPLLGIAGIVPSINPETRLSDILVSASAAGPRIMPGWTVVSCISLLAAKVHAARSASVFPTQ
jgi:hypothetical protein